MLLLHLEPEKNTFFTFFTKLYSFLQNKQLHISFSEVSDLRLKIQLRFSAEFPTLRIPGHLISSIQPETRYENA